MSFILKDTSYYYSSVVLCINNEKIFDSTSSTRERTYLKISQGISQRTEINVKKSLEYRCVHFKDFTIRLLQRRDEDYEVT